MSLKDFQTILVPSKETGALHFYHKPTKSILEAAFSRPNVGATSGARVFDKNGNLIELAENEPDWSFPLDGGCPKILMRPQLENIIDNPSTFSTSLLAKSNPSTNDNEGVAQTQFAVTTNGVNQAFGSLTYAVTEETDYYWWAVFESAGTNDVSFALVDDSSTISLIRYNTDDNSTKNQSGNFSNVDLEDLGNGSYKLSGKLTTATGQTTIAPRVRVLTLGGGSSVTANGQIMKISQIVIAKTSRKPDYITNLITRSTNQYTFDLSTYLTENVVSFYVEASFGSTQQDLFRFGDGGNSNLVSVGIDNQKIRVRYRVNGGSLIAASRGSSTIPLNEIVKIAGVITPTSLKVSYGGAIDLNASIDLSGLPLINTLKSGAIFDALFPHEIKVIALTPLELTDDQLNAATS